jgi:hypothetical protein
MSNNSRKIKVESCIRYPNIYYIEKSSGMMFPACLSIKKQLELGKIEDKTKFEIDNSLSIPEWCRLPYYD